MVLLLEYVEKKISEKRRVTQSSLCEGYLNLSTYQGPPFLSNFKICYCMKIATKILYRHKIQMPKTGLT